MDNTVVHQSLTIFYREEGGVPQNLNPSAGPMPSGLSEPPARPLSSGMPVILIHGFAEDGNIWRNQVAYLKKNYRLIVPDLPGSGRSGTLPGEISVDQLADSVKTLLDTKSIRQCIMIGHSMGGYLTLAFAEKYPDRIKAMGFFHSTAYSDSEEKKAARRKGIEFIRRNGAAAFIRQSTPNLFSGISRKEHPEMISHMIDQYAGFNPDSLIRYYEAMIKRPDRTSVLSNFAGPVLFVIGKHDNAVPFEQSLRQSHMPALSHICILENAGHAGMLEESEASNQALEKFVRFTQHLSYTNHSHHE